MKTKDKAEELVNQYRMILMQEDTDCGHEILCTIIAIKCALLVVDEAQKLLNKPMFEYKENMIWKAEFEYWESVKLELGAI